MKMIRQRWTFGVLNHANDSKDTQIVQTLWDVVKLTNRFHDAVRLFSNRSKMTLKCGKNKKVAHEAIAECH